MIFVFIPAYVSLLDQGMLVVYPRVFLVGSPYELSNWNGFFELNAHHLVR
jgi:hypothetical protein